MTVFASPFSADFRSFYVETVAVSPLTANAAAGNSVTAIHSANKTAMIFFIVFSSELKGYSVILT